MKILIWRMRKSKGVTLEVLASKTGVGSSTLNDYENEKYSPTLKNLEMIAKALDCRISDLYESEYQ